MEFGYKTCKITHGTSGMKSWGRESRGRGRERVPAGLARTILAALLVFTVAVAVSGLYLGRAMAAGSSFPVKITDDLGRQVVIPKLPERIISLTPSNTEILFALGLGNKIVGVTNYSDFPPEAKKKERIGDVNLNFERIVELKPDLVVAVGSMQKAAINKLDGLGITILVVEPRDMRGVLGSIAMIGRATGTDVRAKAITDALRKRVNDIMERVKNIPPAKRPKVFVEIWNEPLMTAGPGTFIDELITLAGGVNIAYDAKSSWPQYSTEAVITKNPDVVILTCYNKAEVMGRAAWKGIQAIKTGRVFEINPDLFVRPGPRLVEGLERLAIALHPDLFAAGKGTRP